MKSIDYTFLTSITFLCYLSHFAIGHGTINDGSGGSNTSGSKEAPSVFIGDDQTHSTLASGDIGLGFGLTAMAAVSSSVGSTIPFLDLVFPSIPFLKDFKITHSKGFLAGSLSFSAGVLLFLTVGDLFPESVSNFQESNLFDKRFANLVSVSIFIGTVLIIMLFKHYLLAYFKKRQKVICLCDPNASECRCDALEHGNPAIGGLCACFEKGLINKNEIAVVVDDDSNDDNNNSSDSNNDNVNDGSGGCCGNKNKSKISTNIKVRHIEKENENVNVEKSQGVPNFVEPIDAKKLKYLGFQIAISLAVHNFPEGLASFATTITSARIGILFAIALALHKIPEGFMIALPIYYSTQSVWKAFIIASSVGIISQMLGALLGYVLFVTFWNPAVSGFLFASVTGTLLYTILHSMLPLARRYDQDDRYCTYWLFGGLFFFSTIAALFSIAS